MRYLILFLLISAPAYANPYDYNQRVQMDSYEQALRNQQDQMDSANAFSDHLQWQAQQRRYDQQRELQDLNDRYEKDAQDILSRR